MKKTALIALIALTSPVVLAAQGGFLSSNTPSSVHTQGGFSGPATKLTTVNKAKLQRDDSWVILQGYIEQRVGEETYTFRDSTGTILVDIDDKRWNGLVITPKDKVQIEGKLDKDWHEVEVDVKNIQKLQ
ncbi:YgiW/YdeI family stress tolerance OB fold protein [Serratia microhaemolytica]|uniref:YgiW/YdeI family stress tolerance OB fold protein n=1 Tax=Serratia microhaemolytica TaxID=2675110 RepID=UPI000FDEEBC5|nr:YgiW/YdeI family stress tolerance OB fold protein [Serratia microhaemolytica]